MAGSAAAARRRRLIVMLKPDFFLNRPLAAVISTTNHCPCPGYRRFPHTHPPRTSQKCVYGITVTTLAPSKRLYCNTIARPPTRIVVVGGSTCKDAVGCERPPRRRLDGRGDAAESPEMCCGGGWSRASCVGVSSASITTRRPSLRGWSRGRWFKQKSRHV